MVFEFVLHLLLAHDRQAGTHYGDNYLQALTNLK